MSITLDSKMSTSIEARLAGLHITLPNVSTPAANYVPYVITGNTVYISGQVPLENGEARYIGKVGDSLSAEDGYEAARLCTLNLLAHLKVACGGDLNRVKRIVRLGGFVNASPDFTQHPQVINGASDLMVEVFGEWGRHARAAVGVGSLPRGVAVEVDAVVEIA
jgi:enamine deaminase RidA (YjgF/YER057c/UK114 family)